MIVKKTCENDKKIIELINTYNYYWKSSEGIFLLETKHNIDVKPQIQYISEGDKSCIYDLLHQVCNKLRIKLDKIDFSKDFFQELVIVVGEKYFASNNTIIRTVLSKIINSLDINRVALIINGNIRVLEKTADELQNLRSEYVDLSIEIKTLEEIENKSDTEREKLMELQFQQRDLYKNIELLEKQILKK